MLSARACVKVWGYGGRERVLHEECVVWYDVVWCGVWGGVRYDLPFRSRPASDVRPWTVTISPFLKSIVHHTTVQHSTLYYNSCTCSGVNARYMTENEWQHTGTGETHNMGMHVNVQNGS